MRILISNDDGINATGIRVLAEYLSRDTNNDVFVVAPDRERSATGHCLTLHKPLRVESEPLRGNVKGAWSTSGTPSDCVKLAVAQLLPCQPDIVIAGINSGPNLGSEILYSGTVAAAMEGAFLNFPSIAVSMSYGDGKRHYDTAARVIAGLLGVFPRTHMSARSLLNVNVPDLPYGKLKGVAITKVGVRLYNDSFEKRIDPRGKAYYWLTGQAIEDEEGENSDTWAVLHDMVSVSPVIFNMTDRGALAKLSRLEEMTRLLSDDGSSVSGVDAPLKKIAD